MNARFAVRDAERHAEVRCAGPTPVQLGAVIRFLMDEAGDLPAIELAELIGRVAAHLSGQPADVRVSSPERVVRLRVPHRPCPIEHKTWGRVDVIAEIADLGLYRLELAPGGTLPDHLHRRMQEAEFILDPGLVGWRGDTPPAALRPGHRVRWPHEEPHGYHNPSDRPAAILCLDRPAFEPDDEIETGREIPL